MTKKEVKRKFAVPSNTNRDCSDMCGKNYYQDKTLPCLERSSLGGYVRNKQKCKFFGELIQSRYGIYFKPKDYIVTEYIDGTWRCSCPHNIFRRIECDHIREAKRNPEKYEIDPEFTGKTIEALRKVFH